MNRCVILIRVFLFVFWQLSFHFILLFYYLMAFHSALMELCLSTRLINVSVRKVSSLCSLCEQLGMKM